MRGTALLLIANIAVYLLLFLMWALRDAVPQGADAVVRQLVLPATAGDVLLHPWTIVTYMFTQVSIFHLIINMLWVAAFASLIPGKNAVASSRNAIATYLLGGIVGAIAFLIFGDGTQTLTGASAAVIAVVLAAAISNPRRRIRLFAAGNLRIQWVAAVALICMFSGNAAQIAAHSGGCIAGVAAGIFLLRSQRHRTVIASAGGCSEISARHNALLNKVKLKGFAALSASERQELFLLSSDSLSSSSLSK